MFTVRDSFKGFYEVKKSQFISFLVPIKEFDKVYEILKKEHPKANHIVWAKRYLNEYKQITENSTDDGEPKKTSGIPVLNVLRGENLINAAIFVVRYFGGVKLGTGGIARAYSNAAKEAVKRAEIVPYLEVKDFYFKTSYSSIRKVEYFLKKIGISFKERKFENDKVFWSLEVVEDDKEKIKDFLKECEAEF